MASHIKHLPWKCSVLVNNIEKYVSLSGFFRAIHTSATDGCHRSIQTLKTSSNMHLLETRSVRHFSSGHVQMAKRIEVTKEENKTMVEGKKYDSEKKNNLHLNTAPTGCPLCEFQDTLTYKDVLILHQFVSPDGRILPRHVTGMCRSMQWKLKNILYQSYSAGLLPDYKPDLPISEDPKTYSKDYKWRKNNVYYDDFSLENPL